MFWVWLTIVLAASDMTVNGGVSFGAFGSDSVKALTFLGLDVWTSSLHQEACEIGDLSFRLRQTFVKGAYGLTGLVVTFVQP